MKTGNPKGRPGCREAQQLDAGSGTALRMTSRRGGGFGFMLALLGACLTATAFGQRIEISWPTPNSAWERGRDYESWVQPTVSGEARSGLWGSVRSSGTQFHEGLDIKPVARDARGEPTDSITAAMDGVVRHVSTKPGDSSYGRYVVLEHPGMSPAVYTLYAHLARVDPGL
ncbi:MAG TPA: M23 family metallopeptidase [Lacunisphaera sp.]|nr:M23 family metallopeptidase [Lacunisphaera sp.]